MTTSSLIAEAVQVGITAAALRKPQPLWLWYYLGATLLANPVEWATALEYGERSSAYRYVWIGATILVLLAILAVTWEHLGLVHWRLRSLAIASLLAFLPARMSYLGQPGPWTLDDKLVTAEGFLLLLCGLLVGLCAPHSRRPDISLVLGLFWIAQGTFSFGWVLHFPEWTGWTAGPVMGILAMMAVYWRLHEAHQ